MLIGKSIGHYTILAKLGEGGMGVVYQARDNHLDRLVAIKLLPPDRMADPERKRRFVQEAKSASALNHPNIIVVHDIFSENGTDFMVMEYVVGKTLEQMIPLKGMPLNDALKIAIQVADALARAQSAGIVHRDLKPSNLIVDKHGVVKVLDFGLAKLTDIQPLTGDASTDTQPLQSRQGSIAGTAAYMSPEQAEGKTVDSRSDIFSFGAVLYEMVSGVRVFQRDSIISTLSAVLRDEPKPLKNVPHDLETIIRRCLRKDPERRWQTAADLRVALRELGENSDGQHAAPAATTLNRPSYRLGLFTTLVIIPLLCAIGWPLLKYSGSKALHPTLVQLTSYPGSELSPSFSPDGSQVAFAWDGEKGNNFDIYVKLIGESSALRLTTDPAPEVWPSWSPDGRHIAFQRNATDTASIRLVSPLGGGDQKLADLRAMGQMSWSPDGKWLAVSQGFESWDVGTNRGLFLVPVDGSEPRRVSNPQPPTYDIHPSFSRKDRLVAYARCISDWACDVFVQQLDSSYLPKGEPRRITRRGAFVRGIAWSRDAESLIYGASISWAMNPRLWRTAINGQPEPERVDVAGFQAVTPAVAPVADQLAFTRVGTNHDIWRYQSGGSPEPFLASSLHEWNPQFSSDGSRIAFASGRSGEVIDIWTAAADGSNPVQVTRNVGRGQGSPRWSPDDRFIAFDSLAEDGQSHVYVVDAAGGRARPITSGSYSEFVPNWSRDGKWLYFFSNRTGRNETWRAPVSGAAAEQVTKSGGDTAVETTDGKTLIYTKGRNSPLFARPINGGSERQILDYVTLRSYAVVSDGIYYIGRPDASGEHPIAFYSFATEASSTLTKAKGPLEQGLSVSPDRRTILFSKSASTGADLILLENFR